MTSEPMTESRVNAGTTPVRSGILPAERIQGLIHRGAVTAEMEFDPVQLQPASMDLRLGKRGFQIAASFLPGPETLVRDKISMLKVRELDLTSDCLLEPGNVYFFELEEKLALPSWCAARSNPRSSTGRIDVFARLIADRTQEYDEIPAGYGGALFLEVLPRTFPVVVRRGVRLNQIRFRTGTHADLHLTDDDLRDLDVGVGLAYSTDLGATGSRISRGLRVAVDLNGPSGSGPVGYRARPGDAPLILHSIGTHDPQEYWDAIDRTERLILQPDAFYLFASKERVRVPPDHAAEMVAYDPAMGEFRIHYAGFFDPGFGFGNGNIPGTPAVLEVRCHEAPFLLEDGQVVGRLVYERMTEAPGQVYGDGIGSAYQHQRLALSRLFKNYLVTE